MNVVPTITSWDVAAKTESLVKSGAFGAAQDASRYAVNGVLEAFYTHSLMKESQANLKSAIRTAKTKIGDRNTLHRALARVKKARPQNPAFN